MMDANKMAKGKAIGTKVREAWKKSSPIILKDSPLPTKSSTYTHKNCINSTKITMKNVKMNVPKKDRNMSRYSFFKIQWSRNAKVVFFFVRTFI